MILQALARLGLAVAPPKDVERPGPDGQRRQPSGGKAKRGRTAEEDDGSPHPVLNIHGQTTGKLIDTEA